MRKSGETGHEANAGGAPTDLPAGSAQAGAAPIPLPELTRVLLDSMTEGVSLSAEDGTIVYTNRAEDRLFGYGPGELNGQHVSVQNAYPPEENRRVVAEVIDALEKHGSWRGDWRNRRKDGTEFVTTARISAVHIEGRRHWLCVQEDVTERNAAESALRQSQARLELATEAAELGIWDWDLPTNRMTYSGRARAICGFPLEGEITFEAVRAVTHPEDYPFTSAQARRALDPDIRDRNPYEYRIVRTDGVVRWVLAHGEAVFAERDGVVRAVRYTGTLQDITDRRALEHAERQNRSRLSLAIEAGRMAVWELDLATDAMIGSPELNVLLGFPPDATPATNEIRARYFPGDQAKVQAIGAAAMARGERFIEAEFRYLWPDNSVRWLLLRCEAILDASGRPARAVGVVMDITDRKRAEEDLRASEARLKLAQQAAGMGVWDWDLGTGEIAWSPEMYDILGLDPVLDRSAPYQAWLEVLHPEDREAADGRVQAVAKSGGGFSIDFRVLGRGDAPLRWVRSQGVAVLDDHGRPVRVVGINMDVTEEHAREADLRALAGNLQSVVEDSRRERDRIYDLSNDLFAVAGFDGYLKSTNPAWERLLGYPPHELLSRPFLDLIHPEDRENSLGIMSALGEGEAVRRFEDRLICADGRAVWIAWAAVPEGDRFYAVGRDITREREREDALRQAQKMEAVGQLTGGIAHDFNNLLQAVHGSLDLISRKPGEVDRVRRWAENGLKAAERGARLTAQLLAFSRAQRLELKPVAVATLISGLEDLLKSTLGPMIRIDLALGTGEVSVLADPTQLEMAVLNLAINARDAMPEGGDLTIGTELRLVSDDPELLDGEHLVLTVSDTGTGMASDVAARAFDPFFTTKGVGKGTGLGLSQVYGMARQAGGTARIESTRGHGTSVSLILRRAETEPETGETAFNESARDPASTPTATILVIDDDADVRRFLVDSLGLLGFGVVEASDGPTGLREIERAAPDLLLVDFAMPGMSGAEVADAVREHRPDLPIVFASGHADTSAIDAAVGASALMLRKPFDVAELEAVLSSALKDRPRASR